MVSEKLRRVLISKTDFTEEELNKMTEAEGWALVYALEKNERELKQANLDFPKFVLLGLVNLTGKDFPILPYNIVFP